jgi:hypothetical protein
MVTTKGLLVVAGEAKMFNKRDEKRCKEKEDVEINVQCAKSLQVHANNGGPTNKTQGAVKKRLEITKQKNEVEGHFLSRRPKYRKR